MSCFPNVNVDQHCDNVTADLLDISLISEETVEKITETRITQVSLTLISTKFCPSTYDPASSSYTKSKNQVAILPFCFFCPACLAI